MVTGVVERWWVGDFITGNIIAEADPAAGSNITHDLGGVPSLTLNLAWDTVAVSGIALDKKVQPWRTYVACAVLAATPADDYIVAGPVTTDSYSDGIWTLSAKGAEQYLSRVEVVPQAAADHAWQLYDETAKAAASWAVTLITGVSWRGLVNRIIGKELAWPNSPNSILLEPIEAGVVEYRCEAIEHRTVLDELVEISDLDGTCEWDLKAVWHGDRTGNVQWQVRTATRLAAPEFLSLHESAVNNLKVHRDGDEQVSVVHFQGGRTEDVVRDGTGLVADAPLFLQSTVGGHTSTSSQGYLTLMAGRYAKQNSTPVLVVSFDVDVAKLPYLRPGNWVRLVAPSYPHLTSDVRLRVLGIRHAAGSATVQVSCCPTVEGDQGAWLPAAGA